MKLHYLMIWVALSGVFASSCQEGHEPYDGLYVSWTMGKTPLYNLLVDDQIPKTLELSIASSAPVDKDIQVQLQADPSLIEAYNRKYQTNFEPIPEGAYMLTNPVAVIAKGNFSTTEPVGFNLLSKDWYVTGRKYMMPVKIVRVGGNYDVIESSRTLYIRLSETVFSSALDLGTTGYVATKFSATPAKEIKHDVRNLTKLTLEARVFIYKYNKVMNTIFGLEENIMARISVENNANGRLEIAGGGISFVSDGKPFPLNEWVHVAVVYDGDASGNGKISIYQNGVLCISSAVKRTQARATINLCARRTSNGWQDDEFFMIGESISGRYLNGMVSEARVWARALRASEIRESMCAVDPQSPDLIAYWRFDETEGTTYKDATGNGFHMAPKNGNPKPAPGLRCPEK